MTENPLKSVWCKLFDSFIHWFKNNIYLFCFELKCVTFASCFVVLNLACRNLHDIFSSLWTPLIINKLVTETSYVPTGFLSSPYIHRVKRVLYSSFSQHKLEKIFMQIQTIMLSEWSFQVLCVQCLQSNAIELVMLPNFAHRLLQSCCGNRTQVVQVLVTEASK